MYPDDMPEAEMQVYVNDELERWEKSGKKCGAITIRIDDHNQVEISATEKSPILRTRRITGYCSQTTNWNDAKRQELKDRVTHL